MDSSVYPNKDVQAIADQYVWIIATSAGNGKEEGSGRLQHACVEMDVMINGKKEKRKVCEKYLTLTCDEHMALYSNQYVNFASDIVVRTTANGGRSFGMPSQCIIDPRHIELLQYVGANGHEKQQEAKDKAILNYHVGGFAPAKYVEYLTTAQKKMGPGVTVAFMTNIQKKYLDKCDEYLAKQKYKDAVKAVQSAKKDIEKAKLPECGYTKSIDAKLDSLSEIGMGLVAEAQKAADAGDVEGAKKTLLRVRADFAGLKCADAAKDLMTKLGG